MRLAPAVTAVLRRCAAPPPGRLWRPAPFAADTGVARSVFGFAGAKQPSEDGASGSASEGGRQQASAAGEPGGGGEQQSDSELAKRLAKAQESVKRLGGEKEELVDKYKRALAEVENTRLRGQRRVDDMKLYGIQSFCKDLLDIVDVLEAAIKSVDETAAGDAAVNDLLSGVKMTHGNLLKVFARHGLVKMSPLHETFDPNLHEALFQLPAGTDDLEAGKVGAVLKTGYTLHQRPIRPAQVAVVQ